MQNVMQVHKILQLAELLILKKFCRDAKGNKNPARIINSG
jgi:hypothetical protein